MQSGRLKPWLGNVAAAVAVGTGGHTVKCSPLWSGQWSQNKLLREGSRLRQVQLIPTHLGVSLRAQSIQKGKHHNLSKDTVVQLGKGASACHHGTLQAENEHCNEPEALATQ